MFHPICSRHTSGIVRRWSCLAARLRPQAMSAEVTATLASIGGLWNASWRGSRRAVTTRAKAIDPRASQELGPAAAAARWRHKRKHRECRNWLYLVSCQLIPMIGPNLREAHQLRKTQICVRLAYLRFPAVTGIVSPVLHDIKCRSDGNGYCVGCPAEQ